MKAISKHGEHKDHRGLFLCVLCVLCVKICSGVAQDSSGTQVFERQIRVVMGSRETQEECREFAKVEARRAVLDQVGVYIEGRSDLMEHVRESLPSPHSRESGNPSFSDSTDLQKRVLAIAAGVTQLEVAGEEWKSEGGALVLYLTCRVTVHPDDVALRLTELVKDRQKVEDYERVQSEVARLREELTRLRADLDSAKSEAQTNAARESVKSTINELTASDWLERGLAATEPDDQIACYSFAIQMNPNLPIAYWGRGHAYFHKRDFDRTIADYSHALQIEPNLAYAYWGRGSAYADKGDYKSAINDLSRALQINPNLAGAYYDRGHTYANKADYKLAIEDYSRAIQIDPNYALAYNNRGIAYANLGEYDRAIADYGRAILIDPNDAKAYYNRGLSYLMIGNDIDARRDLRRAADLGVLEARRELEMLR